MVSPAGLPLNLTALVISCRGAISLQGKRKPVSAGPTARTRAPRLLWPIDTETQSLFLCSGSHNHWLLSPPSSRTQLPPLAVAPLAHLRGGLRRGSLTRWVSHWGGAIGCASRRGGALGQKEARTGLGWRLGLPALALPPSRTGQPIEANELFNGNKSDSTESSETASCQTKP